MKITVYTIKDCAFSKQEKEYLNTNKLQYVEKDLETNKDFLTEMLAVSNNFAGTPVTRVEKDDGTIAVLKGFTKEEFDTTFGFAAAPTTAIANPQLSTEVKTPTEAVPLVETPVATTPDLSTDLSSKVSTTEEASAKVDPLKSVMNDLQSKSQPTEVQPTIPPVEQPTTPTPSIPDFPAK